MAFPKFTVLFGAGASKDAGLPDAFELTQAVYDALPAHQPDQKRLFAIVLSKLLLRNARKGGSPFERVNIEEVYDALKRLTNRDSDPLSEFVSGWDQSLANLTSGVDTGSVIRSVLSPLTLTSSRRIDYGVSLEIDSWKMHSAEKQLEAALTGDAAKLKGASLQPFLTTLIGLLDVESARTDYMQDFLAQIGGKAECLATLNYDRLVEVALTKNGKGHDLGLASWNKSRYVRFHGKSLKLLKLHGSVDWRLKGEDEIEFSTEEPGYYAKSGMIFGGQSDKLVPHGPFLHLRHEFYKFLQKSSYLLVVGYSYADVHLNALIRSWISTRRNGKLINVDPGGFRGPHEVYRGMYETDKTGKIQRYTIELQEIKKGFADALNDIEEALSTPPTFPKG